MKKHIFKTLNEAQEALNNLQKNDRTISEIEATANILIDAFNNSKTVFSCGNGGSMCDAMHFAEELTGRFRNNRNGLSAMAISDPGYISCVSNDFGYEYIFSRFLESHAKEKDILLGISTSGSSKNVINAAKVAKEMGMTVITLTGKTNSELGKIADHDICTPGGKFADRVQELHIKVIHILIELIERRLFPDNY